MASVVGKIRARVRASARSTVSTRGGLSGRVWRAYARWRGERAALAADISALAKQLERQGERIDRLEELARELVLTAESLRRGVPTGGSRD